MIIEMQEMLREPGLASKMSLGSAMDVDTKVRVQVAMLERVALDPRMVEFMREHLESGVVYLSYFKFSNPLEMFKVGPGSIEHDVLMAAFEANLQSSMFRRASRLVYWQLNTDRDTNRRYVLARKFATRFAPKLPSPSGMLEEEERNAYRDEYENYIERRNRYIDALKLLRQTRIAHLVNATTLKPYSWYQLVGELHQAA